MKSKTDNFGWIKTLGRRHTPDLGTDIVVDETIVRTERPRRGRGTGLRLWWATDPDAEYWPGKRTDRKKAKAAGGRGKNKKKKKRDDLPKDAGFGYGVTILKRAHNPYKRRIPLVAIGIHIGPPTGGRGEPVRIALAAALRNGVLTRRRGQRIVADQGFTPKNAYWYLAHKLGFKITQDYPSTPEVPTIIELPGEALQPDGTTIKVPGGYIANGKITCPGYRPTDDDRLNRIDVAAPLTNDQIATLTEHRRRENLLDAHIAPIKTPLHRIDPHDDTDVLNRPLPSTEALERSRWRMVVGCPALADKSNCIHYPTGTTHGIHIIEPPATTPVDMRPAMCRQRYVTFELGLTDAKRLQDNAHGSEYWEDIYESDRNGDERFHSQLKSSSIGGLDGTLETVGIARNGITAAIAVAVTNRHILTSFTHHHIGPDGKPTFTRREHMRRKRNHLFKHH